MLINKANFKILLKNNAFVISRRENKIANKIEKVILFVDVHKYMKMVFKNIKFYSSENHLELKGENYEL